MNLNSLKKNKKFFFQFKLLFNTFFSNSSRNSFLSIPKANPVSFPLLPKTLWQGTIIPTGFFPQAAPTALVDFGLPIEIANYL